MKRLVAELPIGPYMVPVFECDEPILDEGEECDSLLLPEPPEILFASRLHGAARWVAIVHELSHMRTVLLYLEERCCEEAHCQADALFVTQALGRYLGPPPGDRPPRWPEPLPDDEVTPAVNIRVITKAEEMP